MQFRGVRTADNRPLAFRMPAQGFGTRLDGVFDWGHGTSPGAVQLAAVLLQEYTKAVASPELVRAFAEHVIARLPLEEWDLDSTELQIALDGLQQKVLAVPSKR